MYLSGTSPSRNRLLSLCFAETFQQNSANNTLFLQVVIKRGLRVFWLKNSTSYSLS